MLKYKRSYTCTGCGKKFREEVNLLCDEGIICPHCGEMNDKGYELTNDDNIYKEDE
jgi:rRNA maturation endonuclease Nob1